MSKLFVFAIGGTGSRVIRSAVMLMTSGVKINTHQIIPIIIDPDNGNNDLNRALASLNSYKGIKSQFPDKESGFFANTIDNILSDTDPYRMNLRGVDDKKFKDYIGYNTLDSNNKAFSELLFSDYHLNLDMQVGFKGNPNLGSVVLNQFQQINDFKTFALNFAQGDRIFIISSIHGGTGAAGFPLLIKNLLNMDSSLPNSQLIQKAPIGAVTVLPYFKLQAGEIKSEDFVSKTKAALEYYKDNLNPVLNSLYYIGYKDHTKSYENNPGGNKQKNPAHFVELAAALAMHDFMDQNDNAIQAKGQRFMEFGIPGIDDSIDFDALGESVKNIMFKPLSKFMLMSKFLDLHLEQSIVSQPWGVRGSKDVKLGVDFLHTDFVSQLKKHNALFKEWLSELQDNSPSLSLFQSAANKDEMKNLIRNKPMKKASKRMENFTLFDHTLNGVVKEKGISDILNKDEKFLRIMDAATEEMIVKYIN